MKIKMKKGLRIAVVILASTAALLVGFSLYVYFHKPFLKGRIEKSFAKKPGISLTIGRLDYRLFPLRIEADAVSLIVSDQMGEIRATVEHAEAKGSLRRILGKKKPLLESLTLSGLEVVYSQSPDAPPSEALSVRDLAGIASENLAFITELKIRDSNVRLSVPLMGLYAAGEGFNLETVIGEGAKYILDIRRLSGTRSGPEIAFAAAVRSSGAWDPGELDWYKGSVSLSDVYLTIPEKFLRLNDHHSRLEADFSLDRDGASISKMSLDAPGLIQASGAGQTGWKRESDFSVSFGFELTDLARAKEVLAPFFSFEYPGLAIDGGLSGQGEYRREFSEGKLEGTMTGTLQIPPVKVSFRSEDFSIDQTVQGEVRIEGPLENPAIGGFLEAAGGPLLTSVLQARGFTLSTPFEYKEGRLRSPNFRTNLKKAVVSAGDAKVDFEGLSVSGNPSIDLKEKSLDIPSLDLDVPGLGSFALHGMGKFSGKREFSAGLATSEIGMDAILAKLAPLLPDPLGEWGPAGQVRISLEARTDSDHPERIHLGGDFALHGLSFQNPPGTLIAEGLDSNLKFDSSFDPEEDSIPISLAFDLDKGESLWNEAYFNWEKLPLSLKGKADYRRGHGEFRDLDILLSFPPVGVLRIEGTSGLIPKPGFDLRISDESLNLASFYSFWTGFRPTQPSAWELAGKADLDVSLRLDRRLSVRGRIRISDGSVRQKSGSGEITGIVADLPFSISNRLSPAFGDDGFLFAPGRIRIEDFKTSTLSFQGLEFAFFAARNLFLLYPVNLELWGSRLGLGETVISIAPVDLSPRGVSSLALDGLDLEGLTAASPTFRLTGKASIPQSRICVRPNGIELQGRLLAEIYGGRMTVENIRVRDPFSEARTVFFDAGINDLDLEKLTDSVPFGKVTGIVNISLEDFALSYGQPESFALTIQSVKKEGVSRKFSLKAVDDLSVISSGGESSMPSRSFLSRFISSFNYDRIGISCSLRNDIFTLKSTIVEGGVHYLVRRSPLFGIDVVNRKPVNQISFKDMLGRLKRVGQSQEKK